MNKRMQKKVIIYTIPDCPFCQMAKQDLEKRGIKFKEINVSEIPQAEDQILRLAKRRVVPVIVEGGKVTIGFKGV
jgi:glutaredoxin 3